MLGLTSKFQLRHFLPLFIFTAFFLSFTEQALAATLSFSPSTANVSVGNIVSVKVVVNTLGEAINNAEVNIQFPSDLLEVVSVSKSSSVFSLWVEEPIFSNFELNPQGNVTFDFSAKIRKGLQLYRNTLASEVAPVPASAEASQTAPSATTTTPASEENQ